MTRRVAAAIVSILLAGALPSTAHAQAWSGLGGNNNWSTNGNWVGGFAPPNGGGTTLTFDATGATFTPAVDVPYGVSRLNVSGATPYQFTGSTLTFFGPNAAINLSGAAHGIANNLTFGSLTTFTTSIDISYAGVMSGGGGLIKAGPGKLTVTNAAVMSGGPLTINGGTLQLGDGVTAPPVLPPNTVTNATLAFAGGPPSIGIGSGLTGTGNVVVSNGRVDNFGPPLTYAGSTTVTGAGTILSGTVTNNGALFIGAGARVDAVSSTYGSLAGSGLINSLGASLTVGGDGTTTTFSGIIGGIAPFTKVGAGRLILTNPTPGEAFGVGTFTIAGGVVQVGDGTTAVPVVPPNVVVNATIDFAGGPPPIGIGSGLTGTGNVVVSAGRVDNFGPPLTYAGSTTVTGAGTTLSGTVTNNGALFIGAGARVDAVNSIYGSLAGPGDLFALGGAFTFGGDHTDTTFSGTVSGGGAFVKTGTGSFTLAGTVSGPLTFVQGGDLILTGSVGPLSVNVGAALGGTGTVNGALVINEGATLVIGIAGTTPVTQYDRINVVGTVAVTESTLLLAGVYVPVVGDVFTIVTNDGADPVTGTFAGLPESGTVVFNGATLRVSYVGGTGNDITLTAISSTAFAWNGAGANDNWSTAANWVGGVAPPSAATTFVAFPAASARFAPVTDAPWTINRLDIAAATPYAISGQAMTFAGTTSQLASSGAAHGISNPLALASTLTVSNTSALTLSGAIGGAGALAKSGIGALTLSGAGTYAGATAVNAGTLLVNGTVAGAATVNAGGTLGGTGTIAGAVTVDAGGTLAPGVAAGMINTGDLALGGTLLVDIQGTSPGTQYDRANVTGTVALSGGTLSLAGAYVPSSGDAFTIVANDGADAVVGTFTGLPEGATLAFNGVTLQITYAGGTGNDVVLTAITLTSTTWSGAGLDPNWSTGANWIGGTAPGSGNATFVTFGASARYGTNVDASWTINRMDVGGATGYTFLGQSIIFNGAAPQLNVSGATHGIANNLVFAALTTITNSGDLSYAGVMSGGGGLIKAGPGKLTVTNPAVMSVGTLTINGGTLQLGDGVTAPPVLTPNTVTNATLAFAGGPPSIGIGSGLTGTGNVVVSGGRVDNFGPPLTYAGSTTVTGAGTILSGPITNNGALFIGAGARVDAVNSTFGSLAGAGLLNSLASGVTVGGDGTTTTFSGTIGGPAPFTKAGPGRLILTNPTVGQTFGPGTFTIAGGVVQVGDGTTATPIVPPNVVVDATIDFAGGPPSIGIGSGLTGAGNVVVSNGRVDNFGPPLTYAGSTTVTGAGTILSGTVTNNGALFIGAGARVDAVSSTYGSLAGSGQLFVLGTGVTVGGANTNTTFSGTFTGGGGTITKTGTGTLTLTNSNPFVGFGAGAFNVDGGVLRIGNGTTGPFFLPPNVVDNATIEFAGSGVPVGVPGGLTGTGNVLVSGGQVNAFGPPLTHAGSTTITGTAALGATIVNNAPLIIAVGARMDSLGAATVGSLTGAGQLGIGGGGITVGGDGTSTTFSGAVQGFSPLVKTGAGVLTLSGTSTHGGTKTIGGGTLMVTGSIPGPIDVNAGGTLGGTGAVGAVNVNAGGTLAPGLSPGIINTGDLNVAGAMVVEIQGTTLGTQYDNTNVTGTVTIAGGTLSLIGAYVPVLGNVFTIVTNDAADAVTGTFGGLPEGSIITFNGSSLRISYAGGTNSNDITLTAISLTDLVWNGAGANDNWSTAANWVGGLAPTSAATTFLTFPAASARFGPVTDAAFTVNRIDITGGTSYAMTGQSITFAGATPQLNTSGAAHAIANPITLSSALTVTNGSALTLSGAIGGAVALTKTGAGALTLSGVSTYGGGTTVGAGSLLVTGTIPGTVTVGAGATLGGTGTITGPVVINAGGALAPGVSPGVINTGNLTLSGALNAEITGVTVGTQYDSVNVTGTVAITGGTLALTGAYVPVVGDVFTIVNNDAADAVTGTFTGLPEAGTLTFNGSTLRISYVGGSGNEITLTAISLTTVVWSGGGADNNWSTGADWVVGVAPTSGATTFLTFPGTATRFAPVADNPFTINRIDVTSATAYTFSGQAVTFAGITPQLNTSGAAHTIANPITLSTALALSNASQLTLSGAIGAAAGLTKSGAGALLVMGTITGPLTVSAGTLGGTGTIAGPVSVQGGATLAPGLSPGVINTGDLNLAGVALIEIEGTALGTQYDNINVTGTVTIAGATLTIAGAHVPLPGSTFTIISNDGADPIVGTFAGLAEGSTVMVNGRALNISYVGGTGNDVVLAAPAPASAQIPTLSQWALILLALLVAGFGAGAVRRGRFSASP